MNNLLTFWLAPVTALFYPKVYRDAAKASVVRGVLYVLYLSALTTLLASVILGVAMGPKIGGFAEWVEKNMPVIIWTPQGISLENGQPTYTMTHPTAGPLVVFNMAKETVTEADFGTAYLVVTSKKVFMKRGGPGQFEERDITAQGFRSKRQLPSRVRLDGNVAKKIYQNAKTSLFLMLPILLLIFSFIGTLIAVAAWSLVGLLLNLTRKNKLSYEAIFNLSCFASSVLFVILWSRVLLPWFAGAILIAGYLFFAFKVTDQSETSAK
ncbi:MAG TPA: DUF1189 family protein [Candidatus Omnitrophota bacterium]|nr:DUF1189 family protein [Candidatus Omnitrophota bacterium]HPS37272.1 DUF1189 family protein [Candidatus Omnitrophota bacterium]